MAGSHSQQILQNIWQLKIFDAYRYSFWNSSLVTQINVKINKGNHIFFLFLGIPTLFYYLLALNLSKQQSGTDSNGGEGGGPIGVRQNTVVWPILKKARKIFFLFIFILFYCLVIAHVLLDEIVKKTSCVFSSRYNINVYFYMWPKILVFSRICVKILRSVTFWRKKSWFGYFFTHDKRPLNQFFSSK